MDENWTDPSTIPNKLYRILSPNQNTNYDPSSGLTAPLSNPSQCWIPSTKLPIFFKSIELHRDQAPVDSPYISLFENKQEAESWCIAAGDFHKTECYILEIDMRHEEMKRVVFWFVHDIQVMCPKGEQLGMGPKLGLRGGKVHGGRFDSEWLALYHIPGVALKTLKSSTQCRKERRWEIDDINEYAVYGGHKLPEPFEELDESEDVLSKQPVVVWWDKCNVCTRSEVCYHVGGYSERQEGTELTQEKCVGIGKKLASALEKAKVTGYDENESGIQRVGKLMKDPFQAN